MKTFRADCRMCTFCTVIFLSSFPLKKNVISKFTSTTILPNLNNIIIICAVCNKIIGFDIVIFGRHSYTLLPGCAPFDIVYLNES